MRPVKVSLREGFGGGWRYVVGVKVAPLHRTVVVELLVVSVRVKFL